jgi:hypothetical protein
VPQQTALYSGGQSLIARFFVRSPADQHRTEPAFDLATVQISSSGKNRPGLSADERRGAVLNTAFEAFSGPKTALSVCWRIAIHNP